MDGFASKIAGAASSIKNRTEEIIKSMDFRMEINKMEEEIEELYLDIGEMICRYLDSGMKVNITRDIEEKHEKINMLKKGIMHKNKLLSNTIKDVVYCERCGEILAGGIYYCPICGKKI